MKPKNFPARKLRRQLVAQGADLNSTESITELQRARVVRSKKGK